MKTLSRTAVCGLMVILCLAPRSFARPPKYPNRAKSPNLVKNSETVAADAMIARPAWFAATVVGSVIYVISLPVAAMSGSVDSSKEALVKAPARATFKRPLGDFSSIDNW